MRLALDEGMRRPRLLDLALHVARCAIFALLLALTAPRSLAWAVVASGALFFAAFSFSHDLTHGALRLSRRWNDVALAASAMLMLISGHAMRVMHLRHHARPLASDDVEGEGARLSLFGAVAVGPRNQIALRAFAWRSARNRGWQLGETLGAIAIAVLAFALPVRTLAVHVVVSIALQLTMSVWASHVPHNAPAWLTRSAAKLAFTRSPLVLSLAFHELHHAKPSIPCRQLGA